MATIFILIRRTFNYWDFGFYRSYLAVDLFFVLSGFVIAHAYDDKLATGTLSIQNFLTIRLIRLYPVFLLSVPMSAIAAIGTMIVTDTVSVQHSTEITWAIATTALFLPYRIPGNAFLFPLNGVYWSLHFELIANMAYAVARPWMNTLTLSATVFLSGIGIAAVARIHGNLDVGYFWTSSQMEGGLVRSIFGIFLGLLLYTCRARLIGPFEKLSP